MSNDFIEYKVQRISYEDTKPFIYSLECVGFTNSSPNLKIVAKLYSVSYHTFEKEHLSYEKAPMKLHDRFTIFDKFNLTNRETEHVFRLKLNSF